MRFQDRAQQISTDIALENGFHPAPQFFQGPTIAGQAILDRFVFSYGLDYLLNLFLVKKGGRPPVL